MGKLEVLIDQLLLSVEADVATFSLESRVSGCGVG